MSDQEGAGKRYREAHILKKYGNGKDLEMLQIGITFM